MKCVLVKDHLHSFYLYLISLKTASKKNSRNTVKFSVILLMFPTEYP